MARTLEGDRAPRNPRGGPARSLNRLWERTTGCHSLGGSVVWGGVATRRGPQRRRDRARGCGIRTRVEWRFDRAGERAGDRSPRAHSYARGPPPATCRLPLPILCLRGWLDVVRL